MISLVAYSSSEDEYEDPSSSKSTTSQVQSSTKRLLLPNNIRNLHFGAISTIKENVPSQDPQQHDGRVRSFAHVRGNWATYIYINFHDRGGAIRHLQDTIIEHYGQDNLEFKHTGHLHCSLTRTVVLKHHWIEQFVQSLKECIPKHTCFSIHLADVNIFCNDERTRTFLALTLSTDSWHHTTAMVADLDTILNEYRLPPFYPEASFHVSILWCLGDEQKRLLQDKETLTKMLQEHIAHASDEGHFANAVTQVECKIGNKQYRFSLT